MEGTSPTAVGTLLLQKHRGLPILPNLVETKQRIFGVGAVASTRFRRASSIMESLGVLAAM